MNEFDDFEIDEDFYEFVDNVLWRERMPKRYVRDAYNPLEWWNKIEFKKRYRFDKNTVINFIQSLVAEAQGFTTKFTHTAFITSFVLLTLLCNRKFSSKTHTS